MSNETTEQSCPSISEEALNRALERHGRTGDPLGECLVQDGWPDERSALRALANTLGIQFLDLSDRDIDPVAASEIPSELIHKKRVIPVSAENGSLVLAMQNPFDFETVDHLRILTGKTV
jgi:type IV pilus assembly protein PilB